MHHNQAHKNDCDLILDTVLLETKKLLVHEEIIPARLNQLKERIERDGFQSAPVLVDKDTLVVLDGMHRIAVMKELGARYICVSLLDYFSPSIKVKRWCRVISPPFTEEIAETLLRSIGFSLEPYEDLDGIDEAQELLLRFRESTYRLVSDLDLSKTFKKSYELELKLLENGYEVLYCTESEVDRYLDSGKYEAVIYPPKLKKQQVLDAATKCNAFTPKATRHILPARLVAVNVPLSLLKNKEISLEEANMNLAKIINNKK